MREKHVLTAVLCGSGLGAIVAGAMIVADRQSQQDPPTAVHAEPQWAEGETLSPPMHRYDSLAKALTLHGPEDSVYILIELQDGRLTVDTRDAAGDISTSIYGNELFPGGRAILVWEEEPGGALLSAPFTLLRGGRPGPPAAATATSDGPARIEADFGGVDLTGEGATDAPSPGLAPDGSDPGDREL